MRYWRNYAQHRCRGGMWYLVIMLPVKVSNDSDQIAWTGVKMNYGLLRLLADGAFHGGDVLGEALGVSRAAVWKFVKDLRSGGFDVHAVRGKGYRLAGGLELLDAELILGACGDGNAGRVSLTILDVVDSTNSWCLAKLRDEQLRLEDGGVVVCVAEQQSAGRGRRGRVWVSPFGKNLYLSMVREFSGGAASLEGLSLVVGLGVIAALRECGVEGAGLKWPNDVLHDWKKLAGILLEMSGDAAGACQVVVGVGINVNCQSDLGMMSLVDQPWTDLVSMVGRSPSRNQLVAALIRHLVMLLDQFEVHGFHAFRQQWESLHACQGLKVKVSIASRSVVGEALGVTDEGGLRVSTDKGLEIFKGGEVSVLPAARGDVI
jgi:BirA family transcriptional regulator, biotin operon repressor / biotin---[acetyl-CoA-carboxylase] ligase